MKPLVVKTVKKKVTEKQVTDIQEEKEVPVLNIPVETESKNKYWISLDPGINFTGISVIDVSNDFTVIETHLVKNNRAFTPEEKIIEKSQGPRAVKLLTIINKFKNLLSRFDIDMIVIEAPFYNALTPQAYGSLLEVVFGLKYSILVPMDLKYHLIEPTLVKKLFALHGMAKKEVMRQFLVAKVASGEIKMDKPVDELSEHEIDSVAIGYVHWLTNQQSVP